MTLPPRPAQPMFQPRLSLGIVYVLVFFFVYCLALVGPALYEVLITMPPGPEQEEMAREVARETVRPRLWIALVAAIATTAAAAYAQILPGVRPGR